MLETKIKFNEDFPPELRPRIQAYLENARWLFPRWCQEIFVGWDAENTNGCLWTNTHYEYRYIKIVVTPLFLGQGEMIEQQQIIHEIIHGLTSHLADYAREIIDIFCLNDETKKIIRKELTRKNEAITEDFAFAILNKFNDAERK